MPPSDPKSRLERVARDLSRTWLHGSRPNDTAGTTKPCTVATGQQLRVDVPATGPMNFAFTAGNSSAAVAISHADALNSQTFMAHALNDDGARAKYLALEVDMKIPTWIFAQRQFPLPNPLPLEDTIVTTIPDPMTSATRSVTVTRLPAAILQEASPDVGNMGATTGDESFVSLWNIVATQKGTLVSRDSWQPALLLRFPLKVCPSPAGFPPNAQLYELFGTPQGDRYYLDRLGLLAGLLPERTELNPPDVAAISLILETKAGSRFPVAEWTIARTNLTREARSSRSSALMAMRQPLPLPYVAVSGGGALQDKDALRLLQMTSIANSGGYFLRAGTNATDASSRASDDPVVSLIVSVVLRPVPSADETGSAWLPIAANALAFVGSVPPDTVRFDGFEHAQIAPCEPPGVLSVGWTRTEPATKTTDEDKFGYGTISLVEYSAQSAAGEILQRGETAIALSPAPELPGDTFDRARPTTMSAVSSGVHNLHTGDTAAMRLLAPHHVAARAAATRTAAGDSVTRFYRATLACYDGEASPYARMGDPRRRLITFSPAFRDVFGNRFAAASAPAVSRRMFYTDALINPAEWPGIGFGLYSTSRGGKPCLALEASYRYLDPKEDKRPRLKRLGEIRDQLRGVDGDVSVRLVAAPLLRKPAALDSATVVALLSDWITKETSNTATVADPVIRPLGTVVCDGQVNAVAKFDPRLEIARTKADYCPDPTDLPSDPVLAKLISAQVITATNPIPLQVASAHPTSVADLGAATDVSDNEFREIAGAFQSNLSEPMALQVGFLRDRVNRHCLYLIPNALLPSAPDPTTYAGWSFATPRPLSNLLGTDSFIAPDFSTNSPNGWHGHPLSPQRLSFIDQDFDLLGRVAFRLIERESSDLGVITLTQNADSSRRLLSARESIGLALATFQGDPRASYLVPLYADSNPGDLDPPAVVRATRDAFLTDLSAFYAVGTILQLPLASAGNATILTFEGTVGAKPPSGDAGGKPATFSDILLHGGDRKVTILYDLPPGTTTATDAQKIDTLLATFTHIQLPGPSEAVSGPDGNSFSQGPWLELARPWTLTWKGPPDVVPVADRVFPSKPVLTSTEVLKARIDSGVIDGSNVSRLVHWGWRFSFGLSLGEKSDAVVHVTTRYNEPASTPTRTSMAALADSTWQPQTQLQALIVLKLLQDSWDKVAEPNRLEVVADLATSLGGLLSSPPLSLRMAAAQLAPADHFVVRDNQASDDVGGRAIMQGTIGVDWRTAYGLDVATVVADVETSNAAFLTGSNPVRNYRVNLALRRNEQFGPEPTKRPANPALIYQCAPVESPLECWAENRWTDPLIYNMTGLALASALKQFFNGIFRQSALPSMQLEVGISLAWRRRGLKVATPFAILPTDVVPGGGTAEEVAGYVYGACQSLLGANTPAPPETEWAAIRLRVKLTAAPDVGQRAGRVLLEIAQIDFELGRPPLS